MALPWRRHRLEDEKLYIGRRSLPLDGMAMQASIAIVA